MSKWLILGMIILSPFCTVFSQTIAIDSGFSYREVVPTICDDPQHMCHYYKMVGFNDSQVKEFALRRMNGEAVVGFTNFRVLFPNGWQKNDNVTRYPGIVMLHGAGEAGRTWAGHFEFTPENVEFDNNSKSMNHLGDAHIQAVNRNPSLSNSFPGFVIWPQNHHGGSWESGWNEGQMSQDMENIASFLEHLIAQWHLDPDRIAMHGLSNGAKGVWDFASKRNDLIAAVLPFSGVPRDYEAQSDVLVTTPVWLFQGGLDTNPNQIAAEQIIGMLRNKGGTPLLTIYPNLGHGTWNTAAAEPNFFPWIKSHHKKKIFVFGGIPELCAGGALKLGTSAGYLAYQWTLESEDIPGATGRYHNATALGTYTVRFQRRTNGEWDESFPVEVVPKSTPSPSPVLTHTGTTIIPLASGHNPLDLIAPQGYPIYYWYKNGVPWNNGAGSSGPSNVRSICGSTCNSANFAGTYTVAVREPSGCEGPQSNPIVVTFGGSGPPPTNRPTVTVLSATEMQVSWNDIEGETGYEIWRMRFNSTGYPQENNEYVKTVPANSTTTVDNQLRPQAPYRYQIRSVNATGGTFSPEMNTLPTTQPDIVPPTAPQDLIISSISDTQLTLQWVASVDNDVIYHYQIYDGSTPIASDVRVDLTGDQTDGNPAAPTTYTLTDLVPGKTYFLSVRARDWKNNYSVFSESLQVTTLAYSNGVAYKYYEFSGTMPGSAGAQLVEPRANDSFNFSSLVPNETGNVSNFDIGPRNRNDQFVFGFESLLQIDAAGQRRFYTNSDDGSRLYIKSSANAPWTLVVNNDGAHGAQTISGVFDFPATGKYPIRVTFFEQGGGESLIVRMNSSVGTTDNYAGAPAIPDNKLFIPATTFTTYYSKNNGNLQTLGTWGTSTNGNGTQPSSFVGNFQTFRIANRGTSTLSSTWTVSGTSSKVIVSSGQTLILNEALNAVLEAEGNATINANHSSIPVFTQLASTSTVNFTGTLTVPPASYGNVNLTGSGITSFAATNTIFKGNLNVASGVSTEGSANNQTNIHVGGNITFNGTTPNPSSVNMYALSFTGGKKHTITHGASDISLFGISAGVADTVQFAHGTQPRTVTLGTELGGGLSLQSDAVLLVGGDHLIISGNGLINSNGQPGEISIGDGNLTINTTSVYNSNLYFTADHNAVTNFSVNAVRGKVNMGSMLKIKNALNISGAELNAGDGNIALLSNSEGTARIGPITAAGKISGSVNFQRYMEGEGRIYRYLSSPVKGATVADLQEHIPVTGNFTGRSPISGATSPSMYQYHLPNTINQGWQAFPTTTNSDSLRTGKGYSVYVREDVNPTTWELTGTPNQGNITFQLTPDSNTGNSTDGWNLLGNPYTSPIQWTGGTTAGRWAAQGIGTTVYVRENSGTTSTWRNWNGSTGNLEGGIIAPGQAFWVQTNSASPSLTISEGAKHTSDGAFYRTAQSYTNALEISVTNGTLTDQTYIQSTLTGSDSYDKAEDAVKQPNSYFNLSSKTPDGILLAINVVSEDFCEKSVSLNIENAVAGNYTINFDGLANFYHGLVATLKDNYLGTEQTLSDGFSYNFSITSDPSTKGARFMVIMDKPAVRKDLQITSTAVCEGDAIIKIANAQPGVYYQVFKDDVIVSEKAELSSADFVELAVDRNALGFGSTDLLVKAGFPGCETVSIDQVVTVAIDTLAQPEISLSEDDNLIASVANAESYTWYFNGEFIKEETGREMVPAEVGAYSVKVTLGSCTKESDVFNYLNTGIEEQPSHRVSIYPNPFDDQITVYLGGYHPAEIVLHDMIGRVLHQRPVKPAEEQVSIDVRSLVNGVYILKVGNAQYKIIKKN